VSLYEVLVVLALAGVGLYAYCLYRSDTRPKAPGAKTREAEAPGRLMFGRDRHSDDAPKG
jgi:hypothetical protein